MSTRPGWVETDSDSDWDINWADVGWVRDYFDHIHMEDGMRINHFRNHYELTRKDLMVKNLKRMKKQLQRGDSFEEASKYHFWPATFVLPAEYGLFLEEFKRTPGAVWIMKPIGKAQGKGIFLFNKLHQISEWKKDHNWKSDGPQVESYITQRYVESPYLIGGKKFDLRLYVLVPSFSPLVVWLYRTGFARFSLSQYSHSKGTLDNMYMHLTNASVQKTANDYDKDQGCKWDLRSMKLFLIAKHGLRAVDELFYEMQCVITRCESLMRAAVDRV
jgi:tubulin polyglutamylase TTLL9